MDQELENELVELRLICIDQSVENHELMEEIQALMLTCEALEAELNSYRILGLYP